MGLYQLTDEDIEYTKQIEGVKVLYIPQRDFIGEQGLKRKKAIQYLFLKHYFTKTLMRSEFLNDISGMRVGTLNSLINKLRTSRNFDAVFNYTPGGIGPGEVMLYFLTNNSSLGGFKTGDITIGSNNYEVKVAPIPVRENKGYASDVTLGSTLRLNGVLNKLEALRKKLNLDSLSSENINVMRQRADAEFKLIEKEFKEQVVGYFKGKQVIILNNGKNNSGLRGKVETVKHVEFDDVQLYRYTRSDFKALIKL